MVICAGVLIGAGVSQGQEREQGLVGSEMSEQLVDIAEEDSLRADCYALLAWILRAPPTAQDLARLGSLTGDDSEFGTAIRTLSAAAKRITPEAASEEYHQLFIGLGRGELMPFGSYYLTGFLHDRPLAKLRGDMGRLKIERAEDVREPEDHIAALCEMMCGLISGTFGGPADLATQQQFFDAHIGPWAERFFSDLEASASAVLYMPVGTIGKLFMRIEARAFAMAA